MHTYDCGLFSRVNAVEALIQEEVGRNLTELFQYSKGWLLNAAASIAVAKNPHVGLITGFYIPAGKPPSGETDGPLGAAMLMQFFEAVGIQCRSITDEPCRGTCEAALAGAEVASPLDIVSAGNTKTTFRKWKKSGVTHALSIERCGQSISGPPRNMRGKDISSYTVSFDALFRNGPWRKLAIGDGGNEIGMGLIPKDMIARNVANGAQIACVTPADKDSLIVAGVSNWGAYGLIAAMALVKPEWSDAALGVLSEDNNRRILEKMVSCGPSVDGVSGERKLSVDGMDIGKHNDVLAALRAVVLGYGNVPNRSLGIEHRKVDLGHVANGPV